MEIAQIIFYLIGAFILGMAIMAVTARKIFRSAIWLLFSLIGVASLYFWMEMFFIAAVQIIVYVGGIVVLVIFAIFLTHQSDAEMPKASTGRKIASALAVLFGLAFASTLIFQHGFVASTETFNNEVDRIGRQMLNIESGGFALPFEAISLLLLAAMVGCIVIAMREEDNSEKHTGIKTNIHVKGREDTLIQK